MFVVMLQSIFILPTDLMTLGTGTSLMLAHEDAAFKAIFVGSLAVWTGFWIGTNINAQLLKYLFRDKIQAIFAKNSILKCMDKVAEAHGFKIIFFLKLSPMYAVNFIV